MLGGAPGGYAESMRRRATRSADADGLLAELAAHVRDERVLAAIAAVPRDRFVPASLRDRAWANTSLPIAAGQTISQPVVVARMCELLELTGTETVLDVGTGSGYHAAVLAQLAARVVSIERHEELAEAARASLAPPAFAPSSCTSATARSAGRRRRRSTRSTSPRRAGTGSRPRWRSSSHPAAGS